MKLSEIEARYCTPNDMENRHSECFPAELALKLITVAKSAKELTDQYQMLFQSQIILKNQKLLKVLLQLKMFFQYYRLLIF